MADLPPNFALESIPSHEVVVFYDLNTGPAILGYAGTYPRHTWTHRDRRIYGIADYVARTSTHLLIADLKTGNPEWLKMPWEERQTLFLTAVVASALQWAGDSYAFIVSSEVERAWGQEWNYTQLALFLKALSARASQEAKGLGPLTPGEHCTFCTVRKTCPLYASQA